MRKSTYIITLLLSTILCSFSTPASEMKEDEQKPISYDLRNVMPIPLDPPPYKKWPKNRNIVYSPRLFNNEEFEKIVGIKDEREKISELDLKISNDKHPINIVNYIVKLHSYYGRIMGKEIGGEGTATILKVEGDMIYFLTCAHNVVKSENLDPFNPESTYSYFYAKTLSFSYRGKRYPCNHYYVHPQYHASNQRKNIAILVSHSGYKLNFPYTIFPEMATVPLGKYEGYIMGYPGEKEEKGELYGMGGDLDVSRDFFNYDTIDTSEGQEGAPIWANIGGIYKIIGVHSSGSTLYNVGVLINQNIIEWVRKSWLDAKRRYHSKVLDLMLSIDQMIENANSDINISNQLGKKNFLCAGQNNNLPAIRPFKEKSNNLGHLNQYQVDIKTENIPYLRNESIQLESTPYEKWSKNRKVIYGPFPFKEGILENVLNDQDQRKKIEKLDLKIHQKEKSIDITKYLVELHTDYGLIRKKPISAGGTAIIIKIKKNVILLLTCAHNLVMHVPIPINDDPFALQSNYATYYAKNIAFSYDGKNYSCTNCWVYPKYSMSNKSKDIALLVSDRGCSFNFPYTTFPEMTTVPLGEYKGYIIGFPGDKKGGLYGMYGKLKVKEHSIKYDTIDTNPGQSGSPIWCKINDIYKIIGVHTIGNTFYNGGPLLRPTIIAWIGECWLKTQHMYNIDSEALNQNGDMMRCLDNTTFDSSSSNQHKRNLLLPLTLKDQLPARETFQEKEASLYTTNQGMENNSYYLPQYPLYSKVISWLIHMIYSCSKSSRKQFDSSLFFTTGKGSLATDQFLKKGYQRRCLSRKCPRICSFLRF